MQNYLYVCISAELRTPVSEYRYRSTRSKPRPQKKEPPVPLTLEVRLSPDPVWSS